eukprot:TRINITY_DN775891_c0_g1_i1.p1 TRINITY_DN775891_c0_g1~~TRINITY_DN775891_c0_g1_i1.p1  ORF type:complete len:336 (+),score=102.04 TRINITY_DN775891_c0_g1_i1:59-1066(+)
MSAKAPITVVVTGAAGQIGYSILPMIACGGVFGKDQPIIMRLLEVPQALKALEGVIMEMKDCAFPLVGAYEPTAEPEVAFKGADYVFCVGGFPRGPGMLRKDLIGKNLVIFKSLGEALEKAASKTCKILVIANPANSNCLYLSKYAPSIPKENFVALTRLDMNRARAQITDAFNAKNETISSSAVKNITIFGNHSATQYPCVEFATIEGKPVRELIKDDEWINGDFVTTVQKRGAAIIAARGKSSAMSAANAACDCMRDWVQGTPEGEHVAMAVYSTGNPYGIPDDLIYSFPCTCKDGKWSIVEGLTIDERSRALMDKTAEELVGERTIGVEILA